MQTIVCGRWNKYSSRYPETKKLWQIRNQYDRGEVSAEELKIATNDVIKLLLHELEVCGITIISDGNLQWDSIFDVSRRIEGCTNFTQLTRIPNTNHFHRQPKVVLPLKYKESILYSDLRFIKKHSPLACALSLPGPYSLARQTQNVDDIGLEKLSFAFAEILNKEMWFLLNNGADLIRIEEPQIIIHPEHFGFFKNLMRYLLQGLNTSSVALATWFGDIIYPAEFFKLPFGIFAVDFVEGKNNKNLVEYFPPEKRLIAGIFNARESYKETDEELNQRIRRILQYVSEEQIIISANTDFDFLPWDEAMKKVRRMVVFAKTPNAQGKTTTPYQKPTAAWKDSLLESPRTLLDTKQLSDAPRKFIPQIPYITSTVGSFPQNQDIRQARLKLKKGEINETKYLYEVKKITQAWIKFQEKIDITLPVGGEFLREDMAVYFGIKFGGRTLDFVPSYENRRYRPIEYYQKIMFEKPFLKDDFEFVQSLTKRPVKETITGPATLADWAIIKSEEYYHNRLGLRMDLAKALRQEINSLKDAGVKILQIDEPALTTKMENFNYDLEAISETIRGFDENFYLILHICYSDIESLDQAFPHILKLPFHQIHMEMANRNYSLLILIEKYGFSNKDIGLGVIDVHTDRIETVEEIISGVKKIRPYFKPEQIWLTPDCGLKERSDEIAKKKLKVMARAAKICRSLL